MTVATISLFVLREDSNVLPSATTPKVHFFSIREKTQLKFVVVAPTTTRGCLVCR